MPDFSASQWALATLAAVGVGISKSGFPGVLLLHVIVFALLFGARASTGVVLPMLIVGDLLAIGRFHRHVRWEYLWRTMPPALAGIGAGVFLINWLSEASYAPVLGWIILALTIMHVLRLQSPAIADRMPTGRVYAWSLGILAGITTMLANAGGPVMTLYLLAMGLSKMEFTGTIAWFFFVINVIKVPLSAGLGLIDVHTLLFNLVLVPAIVVGSVIGRWLLHRVSQGVFDGLLLTFAAIAALRLIGVF
ncbi:MAG: sulfite exporter TauE/SafE family protein [Acidobacteria bacterium]|nr:sulfite exporter TauE/SafE family protein [Acidobacteriota bacterium]